MARATGPAWSTGWRGWGWAALATVGYVLVASWAHQFAVTAERDLTIWYPGPGILLGLFVECRRWRFVAALAVGELISSVLVFAVDDVFDPARLGLNAVAIAAAYGAGGLVLLRLRRVDGPPSRLPDLLALVVGGVGVGALGAALVGTAMQHWVGLATESSFLTGVRLWWVSDSIGVLVIKGSKLPSNEFSGERFPRTPTQKLMEPLFKSAAEGGIGLYKPWFFRDAFDYPSKGTRTVSC